MIPNIIHQTAPSLDLSSEEGRVLQKNRRLLPDWDFLLYDDIANQMIMEQAFPEFAVAFRNIQRGVVKADIARCVYLYHLGGWYFDTDYRLLRPLSDAASVDGSEILLQECSLILPISGLPGEDLHLVCNSIMASRKGHPFWRAFIESIFADNSVSQLSEANVEAVTGPLGLSTFYLTHRDQFPDIYLPPKNFFHPRITLGGFWHNSGSECYGVHWCWGSWRTKNPFRKLKNILTRKVTSCYR
jgi:mannosyltransferase OCH1-like enzyme